MSGTSHPLPVERRLGHRFSTPALLEQALTHRSSRYPNNERLEYLGDAVLNLVIAKALFDADPEATEGRLTRLRASLVRRDSLASMARDLELGELLRLGGGELKSGGRDRPSILADSFEGLVGALYLDSDFPTCAAIVERLFADRIRRCLAGESVKDPKTRLQESLQARALPLPAYRVISVDGAPHEVQFTVECTVPGYDSPTTGVGGSRRKAEQAAAERALERLAASGGP